ncbi:TnsA endonuclease N-terminal domain-containing protein [Marinimicrobium agarilyticum]|uniref:TnsA endonuclease N-terminal domain-containing protein n=1 Tax=Marinimicrobium agarilyticum TaxID=306546 RepID=UPI000482B41D|nr:TnsA endonuclease N-terminal domain-containing protein [Marinimicrobium agarilyticum]
MTKNYALNTDQAIKELGKWRTLCASIGEYRSFVRVSQTKFVGRRHLHLCPRQNRPITLLSDGEYRAYQMLLWRSNATAIYEQFPLDIEETIDISDELGVIHPNGWDRKSRIRYAHVMSTDFLVNHLDCRTGETISTAYTFKYHNSIYPLELNRSVRRTWQKLDIEKEFWRRRNVEYRVITERDATKPIAYNLDLCRFEYDPDAQLDVLGQFSKSFSATWCENRFVDLRTIIESTSKSMGITSKRAITIFKNAILYRVLPINLDNRIEFYRAVEMNI